MKFLALAPCALLFVAIALCGCHRHHHDHHDDHHHHKLDVTNHSDATVTALQAGEDVHYGLIAPGETSSFDAPVGVDVAVFYDDGSRDDFPGVEGPVLLGR